MDRLPTRRYDVLRKPADGVPYVKPVDQPHSQLLTAPNCYPLPAVLVTYADDVRAVVTAWELNDQEVADVLATGRIWLEVRGITQPPVVLSTRCPYADDPLENNSASGASE
jgi:hypothetical protein